MSRVTKKMLVSTLLLFAACGCTSGGSSGIIPASPNALILNQIGPTGGFIPSLAFNPVTEGSVWASGDDGAGLYSSTDGGATWSGVATGSANQASYSLRFAPGSGTTLFAPNHFGRGILMTTNGGTTWSAYQGGLPISGTATQALDDFAISPTDASVMYAATDNGLYQSTDSGATFTLTSTGLTGTTAVRSVAFRQDGYVFIGKSDGEIGYSTNGTSWAQLLPPNGISVSGLLFSNSSLYIVYVNAAIYCLDKTNFTTTAVSGGLINDPTQPGTIQNGNRVSLAVADGASGDPDTVFVGTMGDANIPSTQWGLFKGTSASASWVQSMNGMAGNSIMSVAVDPLNANNVIVGSGSGLGIFRSTNGGSSWTQAPTAGIYSTASLALTQDPSNSRHLLASNTACGGFSINFETTNGGTSWSHFADPITDDGIFAFDVDPTNSSNVLAGTCTQGIIRSQGGTGGSWSTVTTTAGQRVDRFVRDKGNKAIVYAVVPTGDSSHSLYVSQNSGASFTPQSGIAAYGLAVHPTNAGEGIVLTATDALVSTNSFASTSSLGLASYASVEGGFTAAAYNPSNPSEVVIGGASGGLYRTTNYRTSGAVTWTKLGASLGPSGVRDIVIANRENHAAYYAIVVAPDTGVKSNSTQGLYRSIDGVTWSPFTLAMFPSTMPWRMIPDEASPTTSFLIGMWAGGLYRLTDTE